MGEDIESRLTSSSTILPHLSKASRPQRRNDEQDKRLSPPQLPDNQLCLLHPKTPFSVTFGLIRMSRASTGRSPAELRLSLIMILLLMMMVDGTEAAAAAGYRLTQAEL